MKLKALPFPFWGVWRLFEDCGGLDIEDALGENPRALPAYVGRPGWYYDRLSGVSWYEFPDGKAYEADAVQFLYELGTRAAEERPLRDEERAAIRTLLAFGNAGDLRSLAKRLWADDSRRMLRNTIVEARIWQKRSD